MLAVMRLNGVLVFDTVGGFHISCNPLLVFVTEVSTHVPFVES